MIVETQILSENVINASVTYTTTSYQYMPTVQWKYTVCSGYNG